MRRRPSAEMAIEDTARALCGDFARFNDAFDRGRFLAACGVDDTSNGGTAGSLRRSVERGIV